MNHGGPAFPASVAEIQGLATNSAEFGIPGMSLRDYFAAQVLPGMYAHLDKWVLAANSRRESVEVTIALAAYEVADAMLKAREPK